MCMHLLSKLVKLPAGLVLKAPREMLMDQCIHSDGQRDKGGHKTDLHMLGCPLHQWAASDSLPALGGAGRGSAGYFFLQKGCAKL